MPPRASSARADRLILVLARNDAVERPRRSRTRCLAALALVLAAGLASRSGHALVPAFAAAHAGDALWATAAFLALGCAFPRARTLHIAVAALAVAVGVELSQLAHVPWLDALRDSTVGGLVLGRGFLWSDVPRYAAGVALGALVDAGWLAPARSPT